MIGREKEKSLDPPLRAGIILIPDPDQKAARLKKQSAAERSIMFTIGEFSRICQVSIKTLRHYDKVGLLKPAKVDALTGYRYYQQGQLEVMLLIQRLKRYGFPLEGNPRDAKRRRGKRALFKIAAAKGEVITTAAGDGSDLERIDRTPAGF